MAIEDTSKRKITSGESNSEKRRRDESPNSSLGSMNNSAVPPMSPWQVKILKADLLAANANVRQFSTFPEREFLKEWV